MSNKQLLREFYSLCSDGVCLDLLNEDDKRYVRDGGVILTGILQRADARNGNGRIYSREILERENENYQKVINEKRATGQLDHPEDSVISLEKTSHVVMQTWWKDNDLMGKIKILSTPNGQIAKSLIKDGITLGISSRGLGSTSKKGEDIIVEDDFQLICYDLVQEPSTVGAFMLSEGKRTTLDSNKIFTKADRLNKLINSIVK